MASNIERYDFNKENVTYIGANFTEWFGHMEFEKTSRRLKVRALSRTMTDHEIMKELKPSETTLGDVLSELKKKKNLTDSGGANIFYVRDTNRDLKVIYIFKFAEGWGINSFPIGDGDWDAGRHVFSVTPFAEEKH